MLQKGSRNLAPGSAEARCLRLLLRLHTAAAPDSDASRVLQRAAAAPQPTRLCSASGLTAERRPAAPSRRRPQLRAGQRDRARLQAEAPSGAAAPRVPAAGGLGAARAALCMPGAGRRGQEALAAGPAQPGCSRRRGRALPRRCRWGWGTAERGGGMGLAS